MIVCDKVAYLFTQHLVIFGFVFIVDFGFDIEESRSSFLSALSAMALKGVSILRAGRQRALAESEPAHLLDIVLVLVVFLILFVVVVVVIATLGIVILVLFFLLIIVISVSRL